MLRVLVLRVCVFVVQIAQTTPKTACSAVRQQGRKPLLWQLQCAPQAPYGEYFCFLSCPGTLPTLLRVLVWCVCVFVIQIAQTTPKLPVLLSANKTENRYFGSCSVAPRPPMVNIFVPYHASAVYEQCSSFWCALAVFLCFKFQKSHLFFCTSAQLTRDTGQKAVTLTVSMWPSGLLR